MAALNRYNVFVGSEAGLLKGVDTSKKYFKNLNNLSQLGRQDEILLMCWGNLEKSEICCGLKNRTVKIYDARNGLYQHALTVHGGEGPLKGLEKCMERLFTCVESGVVKVWNQKSEECVGCHLKVILEFHVGHQICKMRQNPQAPSVIATGGKENDLKIWDIENPLKPIFKAKNVANDLLDHRVPVWVTDFQFIPESEKIAVCTGYRHIRVYDTKIPQKRPVVNIEFDDYPLMAISVAHEENLVIVANSHGRMGLFDLRKQLLMHCFKGFAGGIRCVQCHPSLPLVASCGLDRFLRIHNTRSHRLLHKVYLKSRMNCLLFRGEVESGYGKELSEIEISDVNLEVLTDRITDELWKGMEEVKDDEEVQMSTAVLQQLQKRMKRNPGIAFNCSEKVIVKNSSIRKRNRKH